MTGWFVAQANAIGALECWLVLFLLWLRLLPLFVIVPWLGLRADALSIGLPLSVLAAVALAPLFWPIAPPPSAASSLLMAASLELLRGAVLALGCALPLWVFSTAGEISDALRGGLGSGPSQSPSSLAQLYAAAGGVAALSAGAPIGLVRLLGASAGAALAGLPSFAGVRGLLLDLLGLCAQAFAVGLRFSAPVLLAIWLLALVLGALSRVSASLVSPLARPVLLPWLGLGIACLFAARMLDEVPGVVRLFIQKTTRLLGALT
jgi:flagellar biosynthesis protein FliR